MPDQLTLGRPDQVAVIFGRRVSRRTPGQFHTKIINRGVEAAIQVHYRASKVKQYFKEGRALQTKTTINDTYTRCQPDRQRRQLAGADRIGQDINQRLLDHQLDACRLRHGTTQARVLPAAATNANPPRNPSRTPNDGAARLPCTSAD